MTETLDMPPIAKLSHRARRALVALVGNRPTPAALAEIRRHDLIRQPRTFTKTADEIRDWMAEQGLRLRD